MDEMERALELDQKKIDSLSDSDYATYRGCCKEFAEQAIKEDPTLQLVRGWYHCPMWGKQAYRIKQHVYCSYSCYGHDVWF